ncbi:GIY-YIG nuclease family protein, partial [Escherichia coli]|nr:GIY-YIG nuclease family protein [Escherichia coli]
MLEPLDHQGLLAGGGDVAESADEIIDIDNLAAELADVSSEDDITVLRHVRASTEKRVVQGVAD